jgi:DNA-binding TFAR19-related protein (PDSD5 family)
MENIVKNHNYTEEELMSLWYLYQAEQLEEELTDDEIKKINELIKRRLKEDPNLEIWEIDKG